MWLLLALLLSFVTYATLKSHIKFAFSARQREFCIGRKHRPVESATQKSAMSEREDANEQPTEVEEEMLNTRERTDYEK